MARAFRTSLRLPASRAALIREVIRSKFSSIKSKRSLSVMSLWGVLVELMLWRSVEVLNQIIDFDAVDCGVIPAATVGGLFAATLTEQHHQVLIRAALFSGTVQTLIVLDPEGDVPSRPVCPSVESGVSHRVRFSHILSIGSWERLEGGVCHFFNWHSPQSSEVLRSGRRAGDDLGHHIGSIHQAIDLTDARTDLYESDNDRSDGGDQSRKHGGHTDCVNLLLLKLA